MLAEFGLDLEVILVNGQGQVVKETTLHAILPDAFVPESLPRAK
jgi:cytidine deaminase